MSAAVGAGAPSGMAVSCSNGAAGPQQLHAAQQAPLLHAKAAAAAPPAALASSAAAQPAPHAAQPLLPGMPDSLQPAHSGQASQSRPQNGIGHLVAPHISTTAAVSHPRSSGMPHIDISYQQQQPAELRFAGEGSEQSDSERGDSDGYPDGSPGGACMAAGRLHQDGDAMREQHWQAHDVPPHQHVQHANGTKHALTGNGYGLPVSALANGKAGHTEARELAKHPPRIKVPQHARQPAPENGQTTM